MDASLDLAVGRARLQSLLCGGTRGPEHPTPLGVCRGSPPRRFRRRWDRSRAGRSALLPPGSSGGPQIPRSESPGRCRCPRAGDAQGAARLSPGLKPARRRALPGHPGPIWPHPSFPLLLRKTFQGQSPKNKVSHCFLCPEGTRLALPGVGLLWGQAVHPPKLPFSVAYNFRATDSCCVSV